MERLGGARRRSARRARSRSASSRWTQRSLSAGPPPKLIEDRIKAVHFHLVHHAQQLAEASLRKAILTRKPREILDGQIVKRHAARRKVRGAELAERHPRHRN